MSGGQIIGAIVGGVIGFFMGGPLGAIYGAGMGFALGGIVDPNTPDVPQPGIPDVGEAVMTSTVGDPVPLVLGTSKITGHLLAYGKERTIELTETTEGGKGGGGSQTYVTGHDYYMTWVLGLCMGPINTLYTVLKGEDVVWEGELRLDDATNGEETITLDGMGSCTFYFGTDDQIANSKVGELLPDDTLNSPYRNFCWALMDDCKMGKYPRTPTIHFIVTKIPSYSFNGHNVIQQYDCNPAHVMWYLLRELAHLSETWLDESDFSYMASVLNNEYRGISMLLVSQRSVIEYLQNINAHIDCVLVYGSDGKFHPKLIRNDYAVSSLPSIDESVLMEEPTFSRKSWNDTLNAIKVQYSELISIREKIVAGTTYAVGDNQSGAMGDPSINLGSNTYVLVSTVASELIKEARMYGSSSFLTDIYGYIWCTGLNTYGVFGLGNTTNLTTFTKTTGPWQKFMPGMSGQIAGGIDLNGKLWGCGYNNRGQLGLDDELEAYPRHQSTFQQEALGMTWVDASYGTGYSVAVSSAGRIYVSGDSIYALGYSNGRYYIYTEDTQELTGWTECYTRGNTVFAKRGGSWYSCGQNNKGEMGAGLSNNYYIDFKPVVGGHSFTKIRMAHSSGAVGTSKNTVALEADGTLWACGYGAQGQLGQGNTADSNVFLQVGTKSDWVDISTNINSMSAINEAGEIWGCGRGNYTGYGTFWGYQWNSTTLKRETEANTWLKYGADYGAQGSFAIK